MYRKIQCRIWHDRKFLNWGFLEKMVFFYLLTGRHSHVIPGVIIGTKGEIAEALIGANATGDATRSAIESAIESLIGSGVLDESPMAPLMYLKNALRHNPPTSPGQVKMWKKCFDEVPECDLKDCILSDIYDVLSGMSDGMRSAIGDGTPNTKEQRTKNKIKKNVVDEEKVRKRREASKRRRERSAQEATLAEALSKIVIPYLGKLISKNLEPNKSDVKRFKQLVHEGYSKDQMILVADYAHATWKGEWADRISPKALYTLDKFRDLWRSANTTRVKSNPLSELKPLEEVTK